MSGEQSSGGYCEVDPGLHVLKAKALEVIQNFTVGRYTPPFSYILVQVGWPYPGAQNLWNALRSLEREGKVWRLGFGRPVLPMGNGGENSCRWAPRIKPKPGDAP